MGVLHPSPIDEFPTPSVVALGAAFTIWFLVFAAAVLVPIIALPILLAAFLVYHARRKAKPRVTARSRVVRLAWSVVWLLTFAFALLTPCFGAPLMLMILQVQGVLPRIAPRLSARSPADKFAWLAFTIGIWIMLWITLESLLGESDGDYRTWDQIRRHTRIVLSAAMIAAGVPTPVTIVQQIAWTLVGRGVESHCLSQGKHAEPTLDLLNGL